MWKRKAGCFCGLIYLAPFCFAQVVKEPHAYVRAKDAYIEDAVRLVERSYNCVKAHPLIYVRKKTYLLQWYFLPARANMISPDYAP